MNREREGHCEQRQRPDMQTDGLQCLPIKTRKNRDIEKERKEGGDGEAIGKVSRRISELPYQPTKALRPLSLSLSLSLALPPHLPLRQRPEVRGAGGQIFFVSPCSQHIFNVTCDGSVSEEHHGTSDQQQLEAISDLRITVERLNNKMELALADLLSCPRGLESDV